MTNWLNLQKEKQKELFVRLSMLTGLQPFAIEKDAWVTLVLRILFRSELKNHIVFKGGTSLSKAFGLIKRFSEDIDFSIHREYLGFEGELTKGRIRKLRKASHAFSSKKLPEILYNEFISYGVDEKLFEIEVPNVKISDQDPEIVHINYVSIFEEDKYLKSRVLLEIGARALTEPFIEKDISSIIDEYYPDADFAEGKFKVPVIIPEKTLLEKMILLHEEFSKEADKIRHYRMSRHLYDIYQILKSDSGERALKDKELFKHICLYREKYTPIKNVNYQELSVSHINFLPPDELIGQYRKDYDEMISAMIYGDKVDFDTMIEELKELYLTIKKQELT